jgi:hypothetical protein
MSYRLITGRNPTLKHLRNKLRSSSQRRRKKKSLSKCLSLSRNKRRAHRRILCIKSYRSSCKRGVSEPLAKVKFISIGTRYSKLRRIREVTQLKNNMDNSTTLLLQLLHFRRKILKAKKKKLRD